MTRDPLEELDATIDWTPAKGRYWVRLKDENGRFVHDQFMDYDRGRRVVAWRRAEGGQSVKAKRAKTARVYPAESDPRQHPVRVLTVSGKMAVRWDLTPMETTEWLANVFGPWVRAEDGSWMRKKVRG